MQLRPCNSRKKKRSYISFVVVGGETGHGRKKFISPLTRGRNGGRQRVTAEATNTKEGRPLTLSYLLAELFPPSRISPFFRDVSAGQRAFSLRAITARREKKSIDTLRRAAPRLFTQAR